MLLSLNAKTAIKVLVQILLNRNYQYYLNNCVLKEEMTRIATTSATLGNKYTMITGDQATYALALAIRNKDEHMFCNMIFL